MTTLVTGFPTSFLATRVVRASLESSQGDVVCVVPARFRERANERKAELPLTDQARLRFLEGDVLAMDLGLSGAEFRELTREVRVIHHCAAATYLGVDKPTAEKLNIDGVREVLELAESIPALERFVHWSSTAVHGSRRGVVHEDELVRSPFRHVVDETRFHGEALVRRAMAHGLPATILRPATIVGDSRTGDIDRFDGPYFVILLMLATPVDLRVPLPRSGEVLVNLVPVDFVVDAGLRIAGDERSLGRTFHLVDPRPETARVVFARIADSLGKPTPRGSLPTQLATAILRTPGLEKFAHVPRAFLEQVANEVTYDDANTREVLAGSGIRCPPFASYAEVMVDFVRKTQLKSTPSGPELESAELDLGDPLA